jgi:hypothetical protein
VSDAGFKKTFGLGLEMPEGMDGNGPLVDQEAGAQQWNLFRDVADKEKTPFKSSQAFFYLFSKLTAYNGRLTFFFIFCLAHFETTAAVLFRSWSWRHGQRATSTRTKYMAPQR